MQGAHASPDLVEHWPKEVRDRLDSAVLLISVVAIAELRAGQIRAKFGPRRTERDQRTIDTYLPVPLDTHVAERWAHLWAETRSNKIGDNDLWIAATAQVRGWPLVACDRDFRQISNLDLIYLPRTPASRV